MKPRILYIVIAALCTQFFFINKINAQVPVADRTGLAFDGINDYVSIPANLPTTTALSTYSMEFWVKFNAIIPGDKVIIYNGNTSFRGWGLIIRNTQLNILIGGQGYLPIPLSTFQPQANTWYHWILTSQQQSQGVLNFSLVNADNTNQKETFTNVGVGIILPTDSILLGGNVAGSRLNGSMDEVRIWRGSHLNAGDGLCISASNTPDLLHYYNLAEGNPGGNNTTVVPLVADKVATNPVAGNMRNFSRSGGTSNWIDGVSTYPVDRRYYVNNNLATGLNDGLSWANAFRNLDDALLFVRNGTCTNNFFEVWVAAGTYKPSRDFDGSNSNLNQKLNSFLISKNVRIFGGFTGNESDISQRAAGNNTILSGDIGAIGNNLDNTYHVMTIANGLTDVLLDGLVISGGNATDDYFPTFNDVEYRSNLGGGLYSTSSFNCSNVVIANNTARDWGGGVYLGGNTPLNTGSTFNQAVFYGNSAGIFAGGFYEISARSKFENCTFVKNSAPDNSALFCDGESTGISSLQNSIVYDNPGGGICYYAITPLAISYSIIENGLAGSGDGATIDAGTVSGGNPNYIDVNTPKGVDGKWMTDDDGIHVRGCAAIDKGNNIISRATDIALQPRKQDINYVLGGTAGNPVIDLGAYERMELEPITDTSLFNDALIGTSHVVPYPQELLTDSLKEIPSIPIPFPEGSDVSFTWKRGNEFEVNTTINGATGKDYKLPALVGDSSFQRITTVCGIPYPSNIVAIKVIRNPGGQISGTVTSRGGAGVGHVTLYARKTINLPGSDSTYTYTTETEDDGSYSFQRLFYGDPNGDLIPSTKFRITPYKENHVFNHESLTRTLSTNNPNPGVNFIDITALSIAGKVYQECNNCVDETGNIQSQRSGLDGVTISKSGLNDNTLSFATQTSRINGIYGSYTTSVTDPGRYIVKPSLGNHLFSPVQDTIDVNNDTTGIDFIDITQHTITGYFTAGNNDYIGRVTLEFTDVMPDDVGGTRPSEFRKRVTTDDNNNGYFSITLPARKYKVTIVPLSFLPYYASNTIRYVNPQDVYNFFELRVSQDSLTRDITSRDTTLNLVYHRPPVIEVLLSQECTVGAGFSVMTQLVPKRFRVNVYEGDPSIGCFVSRVPNNISDSITLSSNVEVDDIPVDSSYRFDPSANSSTKQLTLIPGTPQIISTLNYLKQIEFRYTDAYRNQASVIKKVLVTGIKSDTGTFHTVSPEVPLLILHDPPGDQSFASWASGTTSETTMRMFTAKDTARNAWARVQVGLQFELGIGYQYESIAWGAGSGNVSVRSRSDSSSESIISTTVNTIYKTSALENTPGGSDDLFVGAAINFLIANATLIKYVGGVDGCEVSSEQTVNMAPESFGTLYVYSEDQIKNSQIPRLKRDAAATNLTAGESAKLLDQANVWQQVLDNNAKNKKEASFDKNISFSGGGSSVESSTTSQSTKSSSIEFTMELDVEAAAELGFLLAGSGFSGGVGVGFKMETGTSTTTTTTNSVTTSYTLIDGDPGDYFSVDVKKDPVYKTPVFELKAGTSSCPPEPGTQPRDEINLTVNTTSQSNLDTTSTAIYNFAVGNTSTSLETRSYKFGFDLGDNPGGAIVTINGSPAIQLPLLLNNIPYAQSRNVQVTVSKGAGNIYSYDGLKFTATDNCDDGVVSKTLPIAAFFNGPCSNISLVQPENNWVGTSNAIPVVFNGYDVSRIQTLELEYALAGTSNWTNALTLNNSQIINSANGMQVNWNVLALKDSLYSMRLKLTCLNNGNPSIVYSQRVSGLIDRKAPELFGKPEPTDDNYVIGDVIGVSYDENISTGNLNSNKVEITRLSNNSIIPAQVSGYQNKIIIVPVNSINNFAGEIVRVVVKNISDIYGNTKLLPDTFQFVVGTPVTNLGNLLNISLATANSIVESSTGSINVKFNLAQPAANNTKVNFTMAGNAVLNTDYTLSYGPALVDTLSNYYINNGSTGSILILKDKDTALFRITPVNNSFYEPDKNISISLAYGGDYVIGNNSTVAAKILDDDVQHIFTFTGNGNYSIAASWVNGNPPPATLSPGDKIIINPVGGTCILDIPVTILQGANIEVLSGKNFVIQGNLTIFQ